MTETARRRTARIGPASFTPYLEGTATAWILAYAGWTILTHVVVFTGGSFQTLLSLSPLALSLVALAWLIRGAPRDEDPPTDWREPSDLHSRERRLGVIAAVVLVAAYAVTRNFLVFWGGSVLFLTAAYLRHVTAPTPILQRVHVGRRDMGLLIAMAAAVATLTLVSHRPDLDDALYVNLGVAALDRPSEALLSRDTLHGIPGLPLILPTYRVHSIELLSPAIAWLSNRPVIWISHLVLPPLFAALAILATALWAQSVLPRYWLAVTLGVVVVLFALGDTHPGYGNLSFVRLHQGKAAFASVMIPLISWAAIRFSATGRGVDWILLTASQVAGVGLTSTGLFAGPATAQLTLAACWRPTRAANLRFVQGCTSSVYPLGLALLLKHSITPLIQTGSVPPLDATLISVLGDGPAAWLYLLALLGAWTVPVDPTQRRLLAGMALGFLTLALNPLLTSVWVQHVTSRPTFWRVFWMIPLPAMLGVLLTGLRHARFRRTDIPVGTGLFAVALIAVSAAVPQNTTLSAANGTHLQLPRLKTPALEYAIAGELAARTRPGYTVLAPEEIAGWVPTFRGHPYPVVVRALYTKMFARRIGVAEVERRLRLLWYVSGVARDDSSADLLKRSIPELRIGAVVVPRSVPWYPEITSLMVAEGFQEEQVAHLGIWWLAHEPENRR